MQQNEYLMLDSFQIQLGTIRRICSRNHNSMVADPGYEKIFDALMKAEEAVRERMRLVRYGGLPEVPEKPLRKWQEDIMENHAVRYVGRHAAEAVNE